MTEPTQFLTNEKGEKIAVVISIDEYEKILDELEELRAIREYDEAKALGETPMLSNKHSKKTAVAASELWGSHPSEGSKTTSLHSLSNGRNRRRKIAFSCRKSTPGGMQEAAGARGSLADSSRRLPHYLRYRRRQNDRHSREVAHRSEVYRQPHFSIFPLISVVRRPRWSWTAMVSPRATWVASRRTLPAASLAMA
jgi:hypothetical protein